MYSNLHHFFDNILIVFDVDTFVKENEKFNAIIIVYKYIDDFVTFDFHA